MTAIRDFARVGENAISAGIIQGHAARTPAPVSAVLVVAFVRAVVPILRALVHIDTGPAVGVEDESRVTGALVSAVQIRAPVLTAVIVPAAFVHVGAIKFTRVLEDLQTLRTRANKTAVEIDARVRTRSLPSALVDVPAGHTVIQQFVSGRAGTSRSPRGVLAGVGTGRAGAAPGLLDASRVVVPQREPRGTLARVRADRVAAEVRTRPECRALVHVLAHCAVLLELVAGPAGATVAARLVHALVLAPVRFTLDALVYIWERTSAG